MKGGRIDQANGTQSVPQFSVKQSENVPEKGGVFRVHNNNGFAAYPWRVWDVMLCMNINNLRHDKPARGPSKDAVAGKPLFTPEFPPSSVQGHR